MSFFEVQSRLKKLGVTIFTGTQITGVTEEKNGSLQLIGKNKKGEVINLKAEKILVDFGKNPNVNDLQIQKIGVKTDAEGFIVVNSRLQTSISHIFAVGDG